MFSSYLFRASSLRARVTLAVVLPLIVILSLFTAVQYLNHRKVVMSDVGLLAAYSGQVIEANLRNSMLESDFADVQDLLDTIGQSDNFRVVYVMDTSGQVIFAPNGTDVGLRLDHDRADCLPCHNLPAASRPSSVVVTTSNGQRVFRSMHPIYNGPECARCHGNEDRLRGLLLTDIPMSPLEASLASNLRSNLLWSIGIVLSTTLIVNVVISRFVLSRLEGLLAGITGLGQGKSFAPVPVKEPDEIGQLATAFNLMSHQVKTREAENRELSTDLQRQNALRGKLLERVITIQEDERKRLARELHDELGQALTGLTFRAETMAQLFTVDPDSALDKLEEIRELAVETSQMMYDLILDLRPSALDDLGLPAALRAYADRLFSGTHSTFTLHVDGMSERLTPAVETSLYRVFQEALSNVVRHAGAAQVCLTLRQRDGYFEGEVRDNGLGFELDSVKLNGNSPRGLGLLGMKERIAQCGGQIELVSAPGAGTRVLVRIPLKEVTCG